MGEYWELKFKTEGAMWDFIPAEPVKLMTDQPPVNIISVTCKKQI
jgi:hypothetical protein